jgi:hypothetical protein
MLREPRFPCSRKRELVREKKTKMENTQKLSEITPETFEHEIKCKDFRYF